MSLYNPYYTVCWLSRIFILRGLHIVLFTARLVTVVHTCSTLTDVIREICLRYWWKWGGGSSVSVDSLGKERRVVFSCTTIVQGYQEVQSSGTTINMFWRAHQGSDCVNTQELTSHLVRGSVCLMSHFVCHQREALDRRWPASGTCNDINEVCPYNEFWGLKESTWKCKSL